MNDFIIYILLIVLIPTAIALFFLFRGSHAWAKLIIHVVIAAVYVYLFRPTNHDGLAAIGKLIIMGSFLITHMLFIITWAVLEKRHQKMRSKSALLFQPAVILLLLFVLFLFHLPDMPNKMVRNAIAHGKPLQLQLFLPLGKKHGPYFFLFQTALKNGNPEVIRILIDEKDKYFYQVPAEVYYQKTANEDLVKINSLMFSQKSVSVGRQLLKHLFDRRYIAAETLFNNNASVNDADDYGITPMTLAMARYQKEWIVKLVQHDAVWNEKWSQPWHHRWYRLNIESLTYAVKKAALDKDIAIFNTLLRYTRKTNAKEMIDFLLTMHRKGTGISLPAWVYTIEVDKASFPAPLELRSASSHYTQSPSSSVHTTTQAIADKLIINAKQWTSQGKPTPEKALQQYKLLSQTEQTEVVAHLIKQLQNTSREVRICATHALGSTGHPLALEPLIHRITHPDHAGNFMLARAIAKHKENLNAQYLKMIIEKGFSHPYSNMRGTLISFVSGIDKDFVQDQLILALKSKNNYIKKSALQCIGGANAKKAIPHIIDMLNDPSSYIRKTAITILPQLAQFEFMPQVNYQADQVKWREWWDNYGQTLLKAMPLNIYIGQTGDVWPDAIHFKNGQTALALFKQNQGYQLEEVVVSIPKIEDIDESNVLHIPFSVKHTYAVDTEQESSPLIILGGPFKPGMLPSIDLQELDCFMSGNPPEGKTSVTKTASFSFSGKNYELTVMSKYNNADLGWHCNVLIKSDDKQNSFDCTQIIWAGDLDNDGLLDMITDNICHLNISADLSLYLSSYASLASYDKIKRLFLKVAAFVTGGC